MIIKIIKPNVTMDKSDHEGQYWESDVIEIDLAKFQNRGGCQCIKCLEEFIEEQYE